MTMCVIQIALAIGVGAAGMMKLVRSQAELAVNPHMGWVRNFSGTQIKLLAVAEVFGAIGVVVPTATGIAPYMARVSAACVAALMGGAVATHAARREPAAPAVILAVCAIAVAAFR